jgi:predicted transcriptional regulator
MIEIFEYIKKLDESGNYRLADKLDNEVRKVYAQALMQSPKTPMQSPGMQENHALNPNFAFILNQMLMKEQTKQSNEKETDTLSPQKDSDVNTIRKQVNKIISDGIIQQKKIKTIENDLGALPSIEGKVGKVSELSDQFNTNINNNTSDIAQNTEDIMMLQESVDTLE